LDKKTLRLLIPLHELEVFLKNDEPLQDKDIARLIRMLELLDIRASCPFDRIEYPSLVSVLSSGYSVLSNRSFVTDIHCLRAQIERLRYMREIKRIPDEVLNFF